MTLVDECPTIRAETQQKGSDVELQIDWQRLVESGETCPRCADTGAEVRRATQTLTTALEPVGITVRLNEATIALDQFETAPLESNRVLINGRTLEQWLGGQTGQSQCCDVCGPNDCRTVIVDGTAYEAIPADLIVQAGLLAAAGLLAENRSADNRTVDTRTGSKCCTPPADAGAQPLTIAPLNPPERSCCC